MNYEITLVFVGVILGGIIMLGSIFLGGDTYYGVAFVFLGFGITFTSGYYFYYRMDHSRPKIFERLISQKCDKV